MKPVKLFLVFLLLVALKLSAAPPAGYYQVWGDEFNGSSLDSTKWDYWLLGSRRNAVNVTNAVSMNGSNLVITTYTSGGVNYTAMVATDQTFHTKYGYWEASIKWGDTNGMWSAIWMQAPNMGAYLDDPFSSGSEIDISEHRSTDGGANGDIINQVQPNVHWNGYGSAAQSSGGNNYGTGLGTGFHTYGFQWTPLNYTIYLDGSNVRNWNYAVNGVPVSKSPEWMIFSSEVQNNLWSGAIPAGGYGALGTSTTQLSVDYARYYVPTNTLFWTGAGSLYITNSANWFSNLTVNASSDLTFYSYFCGNNLAVSLGQDLTVDGLIVDELNNGLSISGNTLTIGASGLDTCAANHTVNLNCAINLGTAQTWAIGPYFPLNVNGNLSGANSLTKANAGTLYLNGSNSFTGTLYVDSNAGGILSDGMVVIANSNALAHAASPIQIRNGNTASSTLGFSGGNINLAQSIQMACRNGTVASLENLSGANTISGNIFITQGGSNVVIQCDSGLFNLAGNIAYNGSLVGNRAWNFVSTGTNLVSGVISNASNGSVITLSQSGPGMLILSNANYFTGNTRIFSGTLRLGHTNALLASTLNLDAGDTGTLSFGSLTNANLGGLAGSRNLSLQNNSSAPVALNVGGSGTYAGILSGTGSFTKSGPGIFSLANAGTYTGSTIVNGGTLKLVRDPIVKLTFDSVSGSANGSIVTNTGTGGSAMNGVIVTNTGTGASGASFVAGKAGNALNLAGDGTTVAISDRVTSLDGNTVGVNWTLAMWLKTTLAGAAYAYQGDGGWVSGNTSFYLNQGNTTAGTHVGAVRWGGGWLTGSANVNDGNWHFIAITDSGATKNIFVDGNLDTTTTAWGNPSVGNQFWIGGTADSGDGNADMNGLIDEVSIYNRALSQTEVRSLTNALPGLTPGSFGGQLPATTALAVSSGAFFDLGGNSQAVASLADGSGGGIITNSGEASVTLTLGGSSATNTFGGGIADNAATNAVSLVKNGAATEILTGVNTFRGTTTVNGGTLIINGALGTNAVSVNGGVLGGGGIINGAVTIQSGGILSPGNPTGPLTINNTLSLSGTTVIELNQSVPTNDVIRGISTVNYGGTLMVTNLGGPLVGGENYQLFDATNFSGNFSTLAGSPGAGLDWKFNPASGVLTVYSTVPTNITAIITNDVLQLSWPADHLGWTLQAQTNSLDAGLGTNWVSIPASAGVTQFSVPLDTGNSSVFYRLIYQ